MIRFTTDICDTCWKPVAPGGPSVQLIKWDLVGAPGQEHWIEGHRHVFHPEHAPALDERWRTVTDG